MLTVLFRALFWIGLVVWSAPLTSAQDDGLRLSADSLSIELPSGRSMKITGGGRVEVSDGQARLVLPEGAVIYRNDEPVGDAGVAAAGDTVIVRAGPDGEVLWTVEVGELERAEADAIAEFTRALGVGRGGAGAVYRALREELSPVVIGVTTAPPDRALAAQLGVEPERSLRVIEVSEGLPAFESGVQPHDVIIAVDGHEVVTKQTLRDVISSHAPGDMVHISVLRRGERVDLAVPVVERAAAERARASAAAASMQSRTAEGAAHAERRSELQAVELERALNDHEMMREQLHQRLSRLETERLHRELALSELHARVEQRESRVAELRARLDALHTTLSDIGAAAVQTQKGNAKHQQLMHDMQRAQAEAEATEARLHDELAGMQAVHEDLAAVRATLAQAEAQSLQQRAELEHVHDAIASLMDERNAVLSGLEFVQSNEGSEALLTAESLAAYQRALAGEERERAEAARRDAELAVRERELHGALQVERAQLEAELLARELTLQAEVERERAQLEAERMREHVEQARREAAMQAERAQREAEHARQLVERQAAEAMERSMQLADQQAAVQHELAGALHARLDDLEGRLEHIEQLLERLLASQPQ